MLVLFRKVFVMRTFIFVLSLTMCLSVKAAGFILTSQSFIENGRMPTLYTCDGKNISPELHWGNPPNKTVSFALILEDPDAPAGTWYHWLVYNIPVITQGFSADIQKLPLGTLIGKNSWGKMQYDGPCPPPGSRHHYIFTLYALDIKLDPLTEVDGKNFLIQIQGHIIQKVQLTMAYSR